MGRALTSVVGFLVVTLAAAFLSAPCGAQDLEPRAYSPTPVGANFLLFTGAYTTGGVVFETGAPLTNVSADINSTSLAYAHTFALFGRSASGAIAIPYVWGTVSGDVFEQARTVDRWGIGDTRLRFVVNLIGGPARTPAEFAKHRPERTLGTSLIVIAPTGEYYSEKLINIGANRWAFKPEVGFSQPWRRWFFDVYAAVWLYTDNTDFFGGQTKEQAPVGAFQGHVSYTFKQRLWLAVDGTFYNGGRTTVDGVEQADLQSNSRIGITGSAPVGKRNSVKVAYAAGATTRFGGSFDSISATWQFLWFD